MEEIQEITECCICTDTFTEPRILPCIHTFCQHCLEETAVKKELKSGDGMPCPLCRKPFVIPMEGMAGLHNNFFVQRLVEIVKGSAQPSNPIGPIPCQICKSGNEEEAIEVPPAVQYCLQCSENICERCCREHKKFKDLQNHQLVQIGSTSKKELIRTASVQCCTVHGKEEVKLFCDDCKEVICMICCVQKHRSHNFSSIDEVAGGFCEQIKGDLVNMSGFKDKADAKIQQINTRQVSFLEKVDDIENKIIQRQTELKELVEKCTKSLLDELATIKQRVLKDNMSKKEECETHKMAIQSFETYCTQLSSKGSNVEICRSSNDVHLRAVELQNEHEKYIQPPISLLEVDFEASNTKQLLTDENILGKIQVKRVPTLELIGKISCSKSYAVTKLENKVYILCRYPSSILVCNDEIPFQSLTDLTVKFDKYDGIWDIISCEKSRCLYVTDKSNRCIWKIAANDNRVTKWLTHVEQESLTPSVTREGHVLLLRRGRTYYHLEIYGSDAKVIRRLSLPSDICNPQQVIKTFNGEFIICHLIHDDSCSFMSSGHYVISRLTSDGQTVICKTKTQDLDMQHIVMFNNYLAVDTDNDQLFAANWSDNRVLLFDSTSLNLIKVLLTEKENGIVAPLRLFYDAKKKQLLLVEMDGEVYIYETR